MTDPFPHCALLQIRRAKRETASGIVLPDEVLQAEAGNTQVAKVVAVGCNCFKNPNTGDPWPEGAWFKVGDYLRIPKFNGFRFPIKWQVPKKWDNRPGPPSVEDVMFVMFEPIHIGGGKLRGDPRAVTAYA